jgi:hypothetical protein
LIRLARRGTEEAPRLRSRAATIELEISSPFLDPGKHKGLREIAASGVVGAVPSG